MVDLLSMFPKFHNKLSRYNKEETGNAYGLFWRKAYIPIEKEPYGEYLPKKDYRGKKAYKKFQDHVASRVVEKLDDLAKNFTKEYYERQKNQIECNRSKKPHCY